MTECLENLLERALKAQQDGDLGLARQCYLAVLKQEPNNTEALHAVAILFAQFEELNTAQHYLKQAIALSPEDPSLYNSQGNCLRQQGQLTDAQSSYEHSLRLNDHYPQAHNNLANCLVQQNKTDAAKTHYEKAIQLAPGFTQAHYNFALLLLRQTDFSAAKRELTMVVSQSPLHVPAWLQLGHLALEADDLATAKKHYEHVLSLESKEIDALNNLAACLIKLGEAKEARHYLSEVLGIDSHHLKARLNLAAAFLADDAFSQAAYHYEICLKAGIDPNEVNYNLGVAYMGQGLLDKAIERYQALLKKEPQHASALTNLGACYLKQERLKKALHYYEKAKAVNPEDAAVNYLLKALKKESSPVIAPADYVKTLFDNYANYFDGHVQEGLQYQVPNLLRAQINQVAEPNQWRILDLGCGTGLSGQAIQDWADYLVGVDLSPKMLEKARAKNIYDALWEGDILEQLQQCQDSFDLIIAADVLVYLGDLSSLLGAVQKCLLPQGFWAFSVECTEEEGYLLQPSGRFAHSADYVETCLRDNHFDLLACEPVKLRLQRDQPVDGFLFLAQRQSDLISK